MQITQNSSLRPANELDWPSVWQLGLSLFAMLAFLGLAAGLLLLSMFLALSGDTAGALANLLHSAGLAFTSFLLLPSAMYALFRLMGKPVSFRFTFRYLQWSILALPLVLLAGYLAVQTTLTSYLILPVAHVLAAAISVGWLLAWGLRGLKPGSPQLSWAIFSSGLVAAPLLSLIGEMAVLFVAMIFGVIYLVQDPALLDLIYDLTQTLPEASPEVALEFLQPYLGPGVLYAVLLFGAVLVPVLEELFKPIGVWLLAARRPSPAQGFAAGLISGAGYALFENLVLGAGAGSDWAIVIVARIGTSLIHILTTGLVGWALAWAWAEKRYLRLALTYWAAVAIHGVWNASVILASATELFAQDSLPKFWLNLANAAPAIFGLLIFGCIFLLWGFNITLRRATSRYAIIPAALSAPAADTLLDKDVIHNGDYLESD